MSDAEVITITWRGTWEPTPAQVRAWRKRDRQNQQVLRMEAKIGLWDLAKIHGHYSRSGPRRRRR